MARIDTEAPPAPVVVAAAAYRRSGLTCGQDVCVANNCGDLGGVAVDVSGAQDDLTPPNRMGYRLELVDGEVPEQLRERLGVNLAGPTPVRLHLAFDQVPAVNARLRIIAIDQAGNESEPSAPFPVTFDGCTLAATGDQCEGDYDADAEYSARLAAEELGEADAVAALQGGTDVVATPPLSGVVTSDGSAASGCSLSLPPASHTRAPSSLLSTFGAFLLAGLALRRRRP